MQVNRPTTDYRGSDLRNETRLCALCANFNLASIVSKDNRYPGYKHHATFAKLRAAAQGGCELCFLLHWTFLHHGLVLQHDSAKLDGSKQLSSEEFVEHHESLDAQVDRPFYLSITITILSDVNGDDRSETINGLTYSRQVIYDRGEMSPDRRPWLGLSPKGGATANIVGRQLTDFWDVDLCCQWLNDCSEQHQHCRSNVERRLPTRLIRLADNASDDHVKLVETAHMTGRYVTLSYCWGGSQPPSATTSETYESHRNGMSVLGLPKLYQDALEVTRALGFQYLWIDSLCIVQDDENDWQVECAQMDLVYENAALTITSPASSDTSQSFLADRTTTIPNSCILQVQWPGTGSCGTVQVGLAHTSELETAREESEAPLNTRSWVAQEYVLAPRVLSFGSLHTYFACNDGVRFENLTCSTTQVLRRDLMGPQNEPEIPKNLLMQTTDDVHRLWYTTINQSTKKSLTWGKDNLPALSGLARRFAQRLQGDTYVAGLWLSDILNGLSWRASLQMALLPDLPRHKRAKHRYQHPPEISPPSWSWIATDRQVSFAKSYYSTRPSVFLAEREDVTCTPVGYDQFGEVKSGILSLRVKIQPIIAVEPGYEYGGRVPTIRIGDNPDRIPVDPDRLNASAQDLRLHDRAIFLFPLWYEKFDENVGEHEFRCFAVVLEMLHEETRCFRRIGCIQQWMGREKAASLGCFSTESSLITIV